MRFTFYKICFITTLLFFITATSWSDIESNPNIDIDLIQKDSVAEKEKLEVTIGKKQLVINELVKSNMFEKAISEIAELKDIISKLGNSEYVRVKSEYADKLEADVYKKWSIFLEEKAKAASENKKWEDSILYASESLARMKEKNIKSPKDEAVDKKIIQKANSELGIEQFKNETSVDNLIRDEHEENFDVKKYFALAKTYKKNREYEKARDMLEKILILEPYNYKATYELKLIYQKVANIGKKRDAVEQKERLAQTQWGYATPIKETISEENIIPVTNIEANSTQLQKKLDTIIIPKIAFDSAPVNSILSFLRKESEQLDTEDHMGINIDLRPSSPEVGERPVTLEMSNVPLGELIKIICDYARLNYKIEKYAVIISDSSLDSMELRYIPIKSDIVNSIAEINNIEVKTGADIEEASTLDDVSETSDISPVVISDEAVQSYFTARGVPFPSGASISWDMPSSTLVIKNTPENIVILENLLNEIDFSPPLVLIEVKFVEITYDKDKGLAFNFKVNLDASNFTMNEFANSDGTTQSGNDLLNNTGNLLNLLQFSQDPVNLGNNIAGALDFFVYALEQTELAELLSSPKIITKSGSTAYFEMVEENYYATSWTTNSPEVVYETVQITPPTPDFEEMKMGIMLQVTPTVNSNNHTVFLDVYPVVKQFQEYDDSFPYTIRKITSDGTTDSPYLERDLLMPIINDRDVKSKLKINDGDTIVLGGMLSDSTEKTLDKYPILGDVPLLGRFFRSEYEVVQQSNLLIFVTAKLINPDGTLVHKPKPNGKFEYKNI